MTDRSMRMLSCSLAAALIAVLAACGGNGGSAPGTGQSAAEATAGNASPAPDGAGQAGSGAPGTAPAGAAGSQAEAGNGPPGSSPGTAPVPSHAGQLAAPLPPGALAPPLTPSGPHDQIVAKINGTSITRGQLDFTVKNLVGDPRQVPAEQHAAVRKQVLEEIIDRELIYEQATEKKISVSDTELAGSMAKIKANFPDEKAFRDQIAEDGLDIPAIQRVIRHSLVIDKYVQAQVMPKIQVTQADETKFYEENKEKMKRPESVRASHILIRSGKSDPPDARNAAKAKAEEILARVKKGEDFAALAKQYSQDSGSAQRGGDLGVFARGQMVPPFDAAAFALKPGEVSGVVETDFGFQIIKVIDHYAAGYAPIDEVRDRIKNFLASQKAQRELQRIAQSLRATAKIEVTL